MAFLLTVPWSIVSVVSQLFQGKPNGFEHVFHYLTLKRMSALRKNIQSVIDCVLNYCFWVLAVLSKL